MVLLSEYCVVWWSGCIGCGGVRVVAVLTSSVCGGVSVVSMVE